MVAALPPIVFDLFVRTSYSEPALSVSALFSEVIINSTIQINFSLGKVLLFHIWALFISQFGPFWFSVLC